MNRWRFIPGLAWRESRTARRRLLLYMSSISLGVAALVAIDSLADNVRAGVRAESRNIMGGDVSFSADRRFPEHIEKILDSLNEHGVPVARVVTFASMAYDERSGVTRLSQVRAVGPTFPPYGSVVTDPPGLWQRLQDGQNAFVSPATLIALDANVGDSLSIGYTKFAVIGTTTSVPGDPGLASAIGPRVFIGHKYVASTQLTGFGSRVTFEALVKLAPNVQSARWVAPLRPKFQKENIHVVTVAQREQNMTDAISRLADFLGIVGMIALLLGGIGVASGVNAFVMRKIDTVAVLRCIGATGPQVLTLYVAQAAAMGFIGAALGTALGIAIQFFVPVLVRGLLPIEVAVTLVPSAIGMGLGIGVWVALVFSLRPLLALRRVSPLQALRRDAEALEAKRIRDIPTHLVNAGLVASVLVLSISRSDRWQRGAVIAAGIGASLLLLWASASVLSVLARRIAGRRLPYVVRQGVANLYRPANQTRSVVLALGFGAFLVSTLYLVQHHILTRFQQTAEASRGNLIFFDVQEDQERGLDSLLRAQGHAPIAAAPLISMQIGQINGQTIDAWAAANAMPVRHWALQREYRSTYRDTIVPTEKVVEGRWFGKAKLPDSLSEVSLEKDVAGELHVKVGDRITWNVQGIRVPTQITSLREVKWDRFEPNFFAVFAPKALLKAPKQFVLVAGIPEDTTIARLQRLTVLRYPNISSVDISLIRRTINQIVGRISIAIRFLALFSLFMAVPVLLSAVAATRRDRLREGVLLKTLGATRVQIGRILLAEYSLLGILGALSGMVLSFGGAWGLVTFVFDGTFAPAWLPALLIAATMTVLAVVIGLSTGREVFRETPMAALREV